MKVADLEKQEARRAELEEAKKAIEIQQAELEKSTRNGKNVPVPTENPLPKPVMQAAVEQPSAAHKGFWGSLFSKGGADAQQMEPATVAPVDTAAQQQPAGQTQVAQHPAAVATSEPVATATAKKPADATVQTAASTEAAPIAEQALVEQQPKKRPFWKIWGN